MKKEVNGTDYDAHERAIVIIQYNLDIGKYNDRGDLDCINIYRSRYIEYRKEPKHSYYE